MGRALYGSGMALGEFLLGRCGTWSFTRTRRLATQGYNDNTANGTDAKNLQITLEPSTPKPQLSIESRGAILAQAP